MVAKAIFAAALLLRGIFGYRPSFVRRGGVVPTLHRRLHQQLPSYATKPTSTAAVAYSDSDSGSKDSQVFRPALSSMGGSSVAINRSPADTAEVLRFDSPFLPRPASSCESGDPAMVRSALIVLNTPIARPPSLVFRRLWDLSSFRVCADGGANRLHDSTATHDSAAGERVAKRVGEDSAGGNGRGRLDISPSSPHPEEAWVPDLIRGDLDSLRPDVRSRYESLGCRVERDPDQDANDLDKALQAVRDKFDRLPVAQTGAPAEIVFVFGAFGGKFDQEMASMQALYKWAGEFRHQMVLYSDETCAFLLPAGVRNEIRLPLVTGERGREEELNVGEGPTCGIIPLGMKCETITTTGLKWNLDGTTPLQFGGLVSTSNRIVDNVVTVQTSHPVIFTAEVFK